MEAESTKRRLLFLQYVYRQALQGVGEALELSRQPPLTAAEKERIFGAIERGVWELPGDWFAGEPAAGWEDEYATRDSVTVFLEEAVSGVLLQRKGATGTNP